MKYKSIIFRVEECTGRPDCKSRPEIEAFLNEMIVQIWIIDSTIDFREFHGKSLQRNQRLIA